MRMPVPLFQGRTPDIAGSQEAKWYNTSYKDSHTRMEPLALASSHGRYITVHLNGHFCPLKNGCYIKPL
jgi:hypothetical protein